MIINHIKRSSIIFVTLLVAFMSVILPCESYSKSSDDNIKIGITRPVVKDREVYEGLDYFIFKYYDDYLDKIEGVESASHFTANDLVRSRFTNSDFDEIDAGFLSQLKAYMKFDVIILSELFTITNKENGEKYLRLGVTMLDKDANKIAKFKITSKDKYNIIEYLNSSIKLILKKVKNKYPDNADGISISEEVNNILKANENLDQDPSLAYFYIKEIPEKELFVREAEITRILSNEGFTQEDILNAFSKKYVEFGQYGKALSNMIIRVSREKSVESVKLFLQIAKEYMKVGAYPSASTLINSIILYKNLENPLLEAEVHIQWSNILIKTKDFVSAQAVVASSTDTSKRYGYIPFLIKSMNNYAYVYSKIGEYETAMKALEYTRKKIEEIESRVWAAEYLHEEAKSRYEMSEFDKAIKSTDLANQLFESMGRSEKIIENKLLKASIYTDMEEYKKANDEILAAMDMAIETKSYTYIKPINEQMRVTKSRSIKAKRAYDKSTEKKYIELYNENIKLVYNRAYLRSMVLLMMFWEHYEDAENTLNKSMEISRELGSDKYIAEDYNLYALIHESKNDYANAFLKYKSAFEHAEKYGSKIDQISCLFDIARMFRVRGNLNEALSTFEVIVKTSLAYGLLDMLENSYYQMSLIYKELNDDNKYIEYTRKAFYIAKKIGSFNVDIYNEPLKDL